MGKREREGIGLNASDLRERAIAQYIYILGRKSPKELARLRRELDRRGRKVTYEPRDMAVRYLHRHGTSERALEVLKNRFAAARRRKTRRARPKRK